MIRDRLKLRGKQRSFDSLIQSQEDMISRQPTHISSDLFPFILIVTVIVSAICALFSIIFFSTQLWNIINRCRTNFKSSNNCISRYWHRQFASISFDSINSKESININGIPSNQETTEAVRIIKNSFSWPEATILNQQKQQQYRKEEFSSPISSSSISMSSTIEGIHEQPCLLFGLRWNETIGSLFIRVISAKNLFDNRHHRNPALIDSYVRVELISTDGDSSQEPHQSMRTHIVKKNSHPVYDELFEFSNIRQINNPDKLSCLFTVLTYDTFTRDEILGEVIYPVVLPDQITPNTLGLHELTFTQDIIPRYRQLCNQQLGQMLVSLCYQPVDSTITLIVLKASNLPRISATRLINPYFKIYMFYKGQRIIKKRSTIKRSTQCPVFNECFTFNIPDNDLNNIHFNIVTFDYDHHVKHEPIGIVSFGNNLNDENHHWNDVCHQQITKQKAQWYQLKQFNY